MRRCTESMPTHVAAFWDATTTSAAHLQFPRPWCGFAQVLRMLKIIRLLRIVRLMKMSLLVRRLEDSGVLSKLISPPAPRLCPRVDPSPHKEAWNSKGSTGSPTLPARLRGAYYRHTQSDSTQCVVCFCLSIGLAPDKDVLLLGAHVALHGLPLALHQHAGG